MCNRTGRDYGRMGCADSTDIRRWKADVLEDLPDRFIAEPKAQKYPPVVSFVIGAIVVLVAIGAWAVYWPWS